MITNRELIEYLQQFPGDARVCEHHYGISPERLEDLVWYIEEFNELQY